MTTKGQNFIQSGVAGGRAWLAENWHNTVVDVRQLPPYLRRLTVAGYGMVLLLLGVVLVLEVVGIGLPQVPLVVDAFDAVVVPGQIPYVVVVLFGVCNVLGWAFILTGATDCSRRVFIPVITIFILQWLITISNVNNENHVWYWLDVPMLGLVLCFAVVYPLTRHFAIWSRYPVLEFGIWVGVLTLHTLLIGVAAESWSGTATSFSTVVTGLVLVAIPFWGWLGVDAADVVKEYAFSATEWVRHRLPPARLGQVLFGLMAVVVVLGLFLSLNGMAHLHIAVALMPLLAVGAWLLARFGRWTPTLALRLFWVVVVITLYSIFFALATDGSDINEVILGTGNVIPAPIIFTLLLLYDVMTFGTRVVQTESPILPRSGRVLLYLGVVILTIGFTVFAFNTRATTSPDLVGGFKPIIENIIFVSLALLGPLYLARTFWKSRDVLRME